MSIINNQFLSLTNRVLAQVKAQKEAEAQAELQKQQAQEAAAKQQQAQQQVQTENQTPQQKQSSSNLSDDLLLTYRGININHIETAQQKTVVTSNLPAPIISNPQPVTNYQVVIQKEPQPATVEISVISKSALASDYQSNALREGHRGIMSSAKLDAIKDMARGDLNALAEAMKVELKEKLGDDYNEKEVQKTIETAIELTLKTFQDNKSKSRNNPDNGTQGFVFVRRSILSGQYKYNVQSLSNTFLANYNAIALENFEESKKTKQTGEVDRSVITNSSIAVDYRTESKRTATATLFKSKALNAITNQAQSDLNAIAAEITAQLKAELGADYDEALVKQSINEAIEETLHSFLDNKTNDANSFVYERKSIFKCSYSYNVKNLADTFLASFNRINVEKFSKAQNAEVQKVKDEFTEKKNEIKSQYDLTSNYIIFNSNFDKAFEEALNSLNATNYDDADSVIKESLNNSLINFDCETADELQQKLDNCFSAASQNYHDMYGKSISDEEFNKLFNNAKREILSKVSSKNSCDIREISNSFDAAVIKQINIYKSEKTENSAPVQTRAVSAASTKQGPITVKGSNGYNISYTPNTDDKSSTGTITITGKDGTSYTIQVNNTNGQPDAISKLVDMLKDIKPELMDDLVKEVDTFDIVNLLPGTTTGSSAAAGADGINGKIYFVYDPDGWYHNGSDAAANPFKQSILAHEVGHMLDSVDFTNKIQSDENQELFWKLIELLPKKGSGVYDKNFKDLYYGFTNISEFFAEYYAYTMCGDTDNKFKELYDELKSCKKINEKKDKNGVDKKTIKEEAKEIKNIIKELSISFDKIIEQTRALPDEHRNDGKIEGKPNSSIPPVEIPDTGNDNDFSGDIDDSYIDNPPVDDNSCTDDNNPFDDNDFDNTDDIDYGSSGSDNSSSDGLDNFNPEPEMPSYPTDNNQGSDFEVITGGMENAGLEAGILPDINPDGGDGSGFNSSYTQDQLDQIQDYVKDQLESQYGDGYQIDVNIDANGNASWHIMPDLDGGPIGDITGDSGLINNGGKYDENGFDKDGYNEFGYDANGYDRNGYDEWGYDENGYDRDGYDEWGYDENGYDRDGYDEWGYNEDGYDENGYDMDGYNEFGYDMDGFDRDGYDEWGYDMFGYDRDGYDMDGYDQDGFDRNGDMAYDGSNDDYISRIPGFGSMGTPIYDRYGNIIGYQ